MFGNLQTFFSRCWPYFRPFTDSMINIVFLTLSYSPGDVVVVYLVFTDVPVVLQPVEAVQTLPVVVRERLVKATVDSVLNDEHSEMRSS